MENQTLKGWESGSSPSQQLSSAHGSWVIQRLKTEKHPIPIWESNPPTGLIKRISTLLPCGMYLTWGGARSVLVPAIPISGLNHVGRHIWPAPSVLGYHQVSGARACHQIQIYGHWYTEVSELTMCFSQWKSILATLYVAINGNLFVTMSHSKCLAHLNKNCPKTIQKKTSMLFRK